MKFYRPFLCILILLFCKSVFADLNSGLIAYYPFNGNANDATGNGYNGTVYDVTLTSDRFGNPNGAYLFNGIDSDIEVTNVFPMLGEQTVSVWVNPAAFSGYEPILEKAVQGWGGQVDFQLRFPNNPIDGTVNFCVNTDNGQTGIFATALSQTALPAGQWSFLTCVIDQANNEVLLYVNGALANIGSMGGRPVRNSNYPFRIGKQIGQQANLSFDGILGDVRVYNRALSSEEVAALYSLELDNPAKCPDWAIAGVGFNQQGSVASGVPIYFGNPNAMGPGDNPNYFGPDGRAKTIYFGCALCSVATMLTSIPGLASINASQLDADLTSPGVDGYSGAEINWSAIPKLTQLQTYAISVEDSREITDAAELNVYLQEHVCGYGDRVILHLNTYVNGVKTQYGHYVFVLAQNGSDWQIFDPGWLHAYDSVTSVENDNLLTSLNAHFSGFVTHPLAGGTVSWQFAIAGVRTYRLGTALNGEFNGIVHSPIEMLVTDPTGNQVGFDTTNDNYVYGIQSSSYFKDYQIADCDANLYPTGDTNGIKTFCIPSPMGGIYQVQAIGTAYGSYTLDMGTYWGMNGGQTFQTSAGMAAAGVITTNQCFVETPSIITGNELANNFLSITCTTQTNIMYSLQGISILGSTNWANLQTFTATSSLTTVSQTTTNNMMFYRVVAQ